MTNTCPVWHNVASPCERKWGDGRVTARRARAHHTGARGTHGSRHRGTTLLQRGEGRRPSGLSEWRVQHITKGLNERKCVQADVPRGAFQAEKTNEQRQQWIYPETRSLEWLASGLYHSLELKGWWDHTVPHTGARLWSPHVPPHKAKGCLICFQQESVTWARAVVLKVWSAELWGCQRRFRGTCRIKTIWTVLLRCSLPFVLCWRLHWWASQKPRLCY